MSWNKALDSSESSIEHMLLMEDPQLGTVQTPNGNVTLIQIVGVTRKELEAAQRWTPHGVLEILKKIPRYMLISLLILFDIFFEFPLKLIYYILLNICSGGGGGDWLVTDMRRGMSMFELDPNSAQSVKEGIEKEGSNLSGVTSFCIWKETSWYCIYVFLDTLKYLFARTVNINLSLPLQTMSPP